MVRSVQPRRVRVSKIVYYSQSGWFWEICENRRRMRRAGDYFGLPVPADFLTEVFFWMDFFFAVPVCRAFLRSSFR